MAEAEQQPVSAMRQNMRTLGLFFLVFLGPLLVLRIGCVSRREICEQHGGEYHERASSQVCSMPGDQACPPTYQWSERGGGCTSRGTLPGVFRWENR